MKPTPIFLLFFLLFTAGFTQKAAAQGNLQFNQVILMTIPQNTTVAFTVPPGKVWKIESVGVGGGSSTNLVLRDNTAALVAFFVGGNFVSPMPFWLPASFSGSFQSTGTNPYRDVVSIIEFNVVP